MSAPADRSAPDRLPFDRDALDWAIRTGDPSFDDWDDFTLWLEADQAHAGRYDAAVAHLAQVARTVAALPPSGGTGHESTPAAPIPAPALPAHVLPAPALPVARRWPFRFAGGAIAAALIGTIGLSVWNDRAQPYRISTVAGRQRTIALADGSEIVMAGGSRLRLDRADTRVAAVEAGAALFRIRHDERHPFTVSVADMQVVDLGTVFDVAHDAGVVRVAVAEGRVMVDPQRGRVRLDPGQAVRAEAGRLERQAVEPAGVGRWREGNLSFDDATLGEVAAVLSRSLPLPVSAAPAIAATRFSGTIDAARIAADPALLGRLLGVRVRQARAGWRLEPLD